MFSKRIVLVDDYTNLMNDEAWAELEAEGYVLQNPVVELSERAAFLPDEPLPESDGKHQSVDPVPLIDIYSLVGDDGILRRTRGSRLRAVELLRFLIQVVLPGTENSLETSIALCECGDEHRHYRGGWIEPLCSNKWVPLGESKQGFATSENIAHLVRGDDVLTALVTTGAGAKLMDAMNVSVADLLLRTVAEDEEDRATCVAVLGELLRVCDSDVEKLQAVAHELAESPELIKEIERKKEVRARVKRNQRIGALVEAAFEEAFRECPEIKIRRKPIGSDYELECDLVEHGEELGIEVSMGTRSCLVELKATTADSVRMTEMQARTAVGQPDGFALCVVPVGAADISKEAVVRDALFICDIGELLRPVWDAFEGLRDTRSAAQETVGGITLVLEAGQTRFAVKGEVWRSGVTFGDFVARFTGSGE